MEIVRAVNLEDIDQLWALIEQATYGLTTLQITKAQLQERVELSNFAFNRTTERPTGEPYVFVMEDLAKGGLVGLCCIFSKTGGYEPFYSYRRKINRNYCELLDHTQEIESLHLEKIHDGPTEIGSLFLLPDYRGKGRGRLLSLCRFSFMAEHPKRFADSIIAEMRGVMDDQGNCPFWEAIGRHFFQMDFPQADSLSTIDKRFIEDLMPHYPIYTNMLSEQTRSILGEVHENTVPALAMLEAEGFRKIDLIDIFDGGPVVECQLQSIGAIQRTKKLSIAEIKKDVVSETQILASTNNGFRAMLGNYESVGDANSIAISEFAAVTLQVKVGDSINSTALYPPKAESNE